MRGTSITVWKLFPMVSILIVVDTRLCIVLKLTTVTTDLTCEVVVVYLKMQRLFYLDFSDLTCASNEKWRFTLSTFTSPPLLGFLPLPNCRCQQVGDCFGCHSCNSDPQRSHLFRLCKAISDCQIQENLSNIIVQL